MRLQFVDLLTGDFMKGMNCLSLVNMLVFIDSVLFEEVWKNRLQRLNTSSSGMNRLFSTEGTPFIG